MKKTLAAFFLALALLTGGAAAFSDVDEGLYYAAPIAWAVERGITTGTSEDTFSPDALCTQGQILTFLWRAAGSPQAEALEAVSLNPAFAQAVAWAAEQGILASADVSVSGGAVLFNPSAPCTRGAAMSFLWRYAGSPEASAPGDFTDVAPNAPYAQAVAWAVERGITSGTSEATFSPGETCTRGQIATFLYRCLNEGGEKAALPEEVIPQAPAGPEPEERIQRTYTGTGTAHSLGLDGSEFTSAGEYEAEVSVDVYSPYEAVFTVKVPFPLYQACAYTVRFEDPEIPGKGYHFTCLRRDEAFSDILPWVGDSVQFLFSNMSGEETRADYTAASQEEGRTDGVLSWRVVFTNGAGNFTYDLLEGLRLSCRVDANQVPAG